MNQKTRRLCFIDTETGGLDPSTHSLLSVSLIIWEAGNILDKLHVFINDGELKVSPEAAKINGYNKEEHLTKAIYPDVAILLILQFLSKHYLDHEKVKFAGHNVAFDIGFLGYFLTKFGKGFTFFKRFSHRSVDISAIMTYLYIIGKLETEIDGSDQSIAHFGIEVEGRHTAEGDNIAIIKVFEKLIEIGY